MPLESSNITTPDASSSVESAETQDTTLDTQTQETTETQETEGQTAETEEQDGQDGTETEGDASAEGEESAEEGAEGDSEDIELTDDTLLKLGDQEHSLADIKEALSLVPEAKTRIAEANQAIERSNSVLQALAEKPADALMGIFTSVFQGDRDKAYGAVVNLAAKIVNKHMEFQALPEGERKALTLEQELAAAKAKLQTYEKTEQETAESKAEATALEKWTADINAGLKAGGVKETPRNMRLVADVLSRALEAKKKIPLAEAVARVKADLEKERAELKAELAKENIENAKKKRSVGGSASSASTETVEKKEEIVSYDPSDFMKTFATKR